uniref:Uncharacterized protein n=1 Tax=Arundo donax TaxID=35708 RepID=A0A0A9SLY3_ARUDO
MIENEWLRSDLDTLHRFAPSLASSPASVFVFLLSGRSTSPCATPLPFCSHPILGTSQLSCLVLSPCIDADYPHPASVGSGHNNSSKSGPRQVRGWEQRV